MYSDMETTKYSIRQATVSDAAIIARYRVGLFRDMGQARTDALATKLLETSTAALGVLLRNWLVGNRGKRSRSRRRRRQRSIAATTYLAWRHRGNYCAGQWPHALHRKRS
jgi:hypothetical protein